jgi:hypothetical protein
MAIVVETLAIKLRKTSIPDVNLAGGPDRTMQSEIENVYEDGI